MMIELNAQAHQKLKGCEQNQSNCSKKSQIECQNDNKNDEH